MVIGDFKINCDVIVVIIISILLAVVLKRDKYCNILDCL